MAVLTAAHTAAFAACLRSGGVAVFPSDTVYGLGCDPGHAAAVRRLHALKGRVGDKAAAVMFFRRSLALDALPELGPRTREALLALLPGAVTLLVANPAHRFALAGGPDPGTLGLRVPELPPPLAALGRVDVPVLQSSANVTGGPEARTLDSVPAGLRAGADLVLDGGALPGTASTIVDLRGYEDSGRWRLVREGAVPPVRVAAQLSRGSGHGDWTARRPGCNSDGRT